MPIPSLLGPLQDALAGRYAIDREIGRGGMATVYLARDVRHERQVALKVLNPDLGAVLGAERFLSEIRVTANLQHPNLLPLFDSGEANGLLFYVMPFVEGESLRQRLERERQLPVDEAVRIAVAIAGALDYAHRRGVIHRDLKPENVLLHEGQPLVADFGIALAVSNAGGTRVTQTGLSLGTPQYMSPEQATSDRAIDGRTDIYSLGAVTYEMLAGEAPHAGATAQAIIARLMTEEPRALSTVRRTVPPHVEAAVHRALEKLPADRFATAEEFAAALSGGTSTVHTTRRLPSTAGKVRRWQIATAAASLVALAAVGFALSSGDEPEPRMRARFVLELPDSARMSRVPGSVTMSHDGKTIAFLTRGPGVVGVWTRRLDELELHRVPGTEGAVQPRFSPDGRAIAFTVGSTLRKVPVEGGSPTQIADSVASSFFAWLDDGTIVFTRAGPDGREALWRVSDAGGTAVQLTTPAAGELEHDSPARLPGGKAAVFAIDDGSAGPASSELAVVRIADGAITRLGIKGTTALYADGFLFFVRPDGTYGAVPFDVQRTRVTGEEISVDGRGSGIIGENGTRVYYPNADAMELMSFDRKGIAERLIAETRPYWHPRLSPDGRRLLVSIGTPPAEREIWVIDRESRTLTKISSGGFQYPDGWTPDGRRVIWTHGGGSPSLWWQPWDASAPAERMLDSAQGARLFPGGQEFITTLVRPGGRREMRIVPLPVDTTRWSDPITLRREIAGFAKARPSPDGKWIAFTDQQSGVSEVFVYAREGGGRYQISVGGGDEPVWGRNSTELFYRAPQQGIMAATLALGTEARVVRREMLFPIGFAPGGVAPNYDVTADGKFIIPRPIAITEWPIVVIGWTDELREQQRGTR